MKKQIIRVSPLQTAKVFGLLYFFLGIVMVAVMAIPTLLAPEPRPRFFPGLLLVMPFLYALFGFLATLIGAWVYNLLAGWVGGIEFETREV